MDIMAIQIVEDQDASIFLTEDDRFESQLVQTHQEQNETGRPSRFYTGTYYCPLIFSTTFQKFSRSSASGPSAGGYRRFRVISWAWGCRIFNQGDQALSENDTASPFCTNLFRVFLPMKSDIGCVVIFCT